MNKNLLKQLPPVQELLNHPLIRNHPMAAGYKKLLVQEKLENQRRRILAGKIAGNLNRASLTKKIVKEVMDEIRWLLSPQLKKVINATGILLHTNQGRAPLAQTAITEIQQTAANCNLELNLDTGKRGDRQSTVEQLLCLLTGAESALVVNNNAAALLLVLNSLCRRKEVPVSRGELVEIGGSFRMPEVMKLSGAKMVEVGSTNKTHFSDYQAVINKRTAGLLKVHTSNYRILGFTQSVPLEELTTLAHDNNMPVIYDMGSGVIEDLQQWGYPHEPVAREYIETGVDVITFSGDKILGGPQSGIIIGKKKYLDRIRKNHLLRALRCGKLTYAALGATLRLYLEPERVSSELPVAKMLRTDLNELRERAHRMAKELEGLAVKTAVLDTASQMGSGALPLEKIPSVALRLVPEGTSLNRFAAALRQQDPAIMGYIEDDGYLLNLRSVPPDDLHLITAAVRQVLKH